MYLHKMTSVQAEAVLKQDPIIVIPTGSTEQHGPQCALGTDFLVPQHLADRISGKNNVIVTPAIPFGVCPYHMSFAGSIDIGYEGLYMLMSGITRSLMHHGARRFLVINGHGGNNPALDKVALDVYHAGGIMAGIDWWSVVGQIDERFANGGHGDILETSAMMAVDESCVDLSLSRDMAPVHPTAEIKAQYIQMVNFKGGLIRLARDTKELATNGWFGPGDPRESTKEFGQDMLDVCVEFISEFIEEYRKL
ncbi:creatininase family protein [Sediminispirochaeta bajacaliforniensis]|uniref:creatininase family protein n=1 Tax=Sediminispirochaeta bajacaliforniensis TaxID=148 RepID=UPI0003A69948|nr:creatininase family protein [Sediminispirochaeta bajacaliforniensis]